MNGRTCGRIYDWELHQKRVKEGGDRREVAHWADRSNRESGNGAYIRRFCFYQGLTGQTGSTVEVNSLSAGGYEKIQRPGLTALKNDRFGNLIHQTAKALSCREGRCGRASFNHLQINPGLYQNRFNAL